MVADPYSGQTNPTSPTAPAPDLAPDFAALLAGHDVPLLEQSGSSIVGLFADLRIGYLNPAWRRFAVDNHGGGVVERWSLGSDLRTAISPDLQRFYAEAYQDVLARGEPWEHTYECSSPEVHRICRQHVFPLGRRGLLISHSPVVAEPRVERGHAAIAARYRAANGLIVQCSYCRKTRVAAEPQRWEFVPAYVAASPPDTSHGLCPVCIGHYFPAPSRAAR